jgi:formylmethanofuran dehydrogenase subunit A
MDRIQRLQEATKSYRRRLDLIEASSEDFHTISAAMRYAEKQIKKGKIVTIQKDLDNISDKKSVFYDVSVKKGRDFF